MPLNFAFSDIACLMVQHGASHFGMFPDQFVEAEPLPWSEGVIAEADRPAATLCFILEPVDKLPPGVGEKWRIAGDALAPVEPPIAVSVGIVDLQAGDAVALL